MRVFADSAAGTSLDFLQYGVLGLVITALLAGWLWAKPAVDQLREDKQRVERQRDALIEAYETQVIPVLTDVQRELVPATSSLAAVIRDLKAEASVEQQHIRRELAALRHEVDLLRKGRQRPSGPT